MDAPARHQAILDALQTARHVDVGELSRQLDVSEMTIRRDLAELDRTGQLHRVHGGAVPRRAPSFGSRVFAHAAEKERIAAAVARLVPPGAAVGIDSGTTCRAVASALADRADLTVVTNSLHAAVELQASGSRVLMIGGQLTPEMTTVGAPLPDVHLDAVVLGCGGIAADRGITYFDPAEVEVRRSLVAMADRVILAADHTKAGRKKAMVLGRLDLIEVLVTDTAPPGTLRAALDEAGTDVVIAA